MLPIHLDVTRSASTHGCLVQNQLEILWKEHGLGKGSVHAIAPKCPNEVMFNSLNRDKLGWLHSDLAKNSFKVTPIWEGEKVLMRLQLSHKKEQVLG